MNYIAENARTRHMTRVGAVSRQINNPEAAGSSTPAGIAAGARGAHRGKRASPEHALQVSVRRYLLLCLPPEIEWTASLVGVNLGMKARARAKAAGVRPGWPDLQFLFLDGVTRYIELKAGASLSPEQREFRDRCAPHGIWAVCRSVNDVERALRGWGARMRNNPFELRGA